MMWIGKMDAVKALEEGGKDDAATGELVDSETNMFETKLTQVSIFSLKNLMNISTLTLLPGSSWLKRDLT